MNWNWKTIILIIILGIATFYGVLWYLKWQDKKEWENIKKAKTTEVEEELTPEEILNHMPNLTKDTETTEESKENLELTKEMPDLNKTQNLETQNIITPQIQTRSIQEQMAPVAPTEEQKKIIEMMPNLNK